MHKELAPQPDTMRHIQWDPTTKDSSALSATTQDLVEGADEVFELRALCDLTWEQLARLLNVSDDEVDAWISGKLMPRKRDQHLRRTLAAVEIIDRGEDQLNGEILFREHNGQIPIELLRAGEYDRVVEMLGVGPGRVRFPKDPPSADCYKLCPPLPPHILADAIQDPVQFELEPMIASGPIEAKWGE